MYGFNAAPVGLEFNMTSQITQSMKKQEAFPHYFIKKHKKSILSLLKFHL